MGLYEFIGWVGAISFIVAYFLLVAGYLSSDKPTYHILNAIGGICLVANALHILDSPTIAVNTVWTLIALLAIIKLAKK